MPAEPTPAASSILLIEDSPGDARLMRTALESLPGPRARITHAATLGDGLRALRAERHDLVVTDLHLPDSDGIETCLALCAGAPDLPVVVLTSDLQSELAEQALAAGAQDFLIKGQMGRADLLRVLRHAQQRHQAAQAQRSTERRFRALIASTSTVIYRIPPQGRAPDFISDNAVDLLDASPAQLLAADSAWDAQCHPDDRAAVAACLDAVRAGGARSLERRFRKPSGAWAWVLEDMKPLAPPAGERGAVVGCLTDITERKRLELELRAAVDAAREASRAKSAFISNMSHELRTPLNAVIGFAELLSDLVAGDLTAKQARYVENILSSSRHLLSLITEVLDLAKIEAGKMRLQASAFDAMGVLGGTIDLLRPLADKKSVALAWRAPGPLAVTADEQQFRQMIYNLVSNAIAYTPTAGSVEVGAAAVDGLLRVTVTDTGKGLSEEDCEIIFDEFVQASGTGRSGTGLGLTLTRRMAELHGGSVSVRSDGPGRGSVFTLDLPVAAAKAADLAAPANAAATVLIIAAEQLDRELLGDVVARAGCAALTATSGADGLAAAIASQPSAVIIDLLLPDMDGLELARDLRADPRTTHAPIIAVSTRAAATDRAAAIAAGCAIHLAKPVDTRTLRTVLGEILRSTRARTARR